MIWKVGASAIVGAVALWLAGATQSRHVTTIDRDEATRLATSDLRVYWAELTARASTLAQLPRLVAATGTDVATVNDLREDELGFHAGPNETVQLGQLGARGPIQLLRRPATSTIAIDLGKAGPRVTFDRDQLVLADVVTFETNDNRDVRGAIGVARTAAPETVFAGLAAATPAKIEIGTRTATIGNFNGDGLRIPLAAPGLDATLVVPLHSESTGLGIALRVAAFGWLLACAAGFVVVSRRRRTIVIPPVRIVAQPTQRLAVGSKHFGRYETVSLLGEGGTSSVFLARSTGAEGFERQVALKILRPELAQDPRMVALFLDEARLAARINHPNVVQIHDLGHDESGYFIAMEHIDGDDLESLLNDVRDDGRTVPLDLAIAIACRVCDGLHAAHVASDSHGNSLQLVHRDVKPGNVFVSRSGNVKIGDFGIAKATMQRHLSGIGQVSGTAEFMAPEQRMGKAVDARTDVFGVAAMAYEMITGTTVNLDLNRMLALGMENWPHLPRLAELRPSAPAALEAIIFKALSFDPNDRHASCAELERDLDRVMQDFGWSVNGKRLGQWITSELNERDLRRATTLIAPRRSERRVTP